MNSIFDKVSSPEMAADAVVCPESARKRNAERQRNFRLRRQRKLRPFAVLHKECRECGRSIKPSVVRCFCPGGVCRAAFFAKIQVLTVFPVTLADRSLSESVLKEAR